MNKSNLLLSILCGGALLSACTDKETAGGSANFNPAEAIVIDDFYPDSGGVATSLIISGSNFGTDTTGMKVLFVDKNQKEHPGGLISTNGEKIYCTVPNGLTNMRNIKIKVQRNDGNKVIASTANRNFIYKTETAVSTIIGQPNKTPQPTVPKSLTSTTLSGPAYICLDNEDNLFIVERKHWTGGRADGVQPKDSKGNDCDGNMLMASLKKDDVRFLKEKVANINAPAFCDLPGEEAIYVPIDGGLDFYTYLKSSGYAHRQQRALTTEESKGLKDNNWKFCFVVNKIDHMIYTTMHQGQLVRINPRTRKVEILLKKIGIHGENNSGSDSFCTFSPIQPNRLFICQTDNGEIWYVDIDQLEGKDKDSYHGEPYAGHAAFSGSPSEYRGWEDGLLKNAKFNYPRQICFTNDGKLYIADTMNSCIRCIDTTQPDDKAVVTTAIGIPGSAGFVEGGPDKALFRYPRGVAVNADGSIVYVADTGNRCIRRLTIQ